MRYFIIMLFVAAVALPLWAEPANETPGDSLTKAPPAAAVAVLADSTKTQPAADTAHVPAPAQARMETLTTAMSGVDTLDILPKVIETSVDGGIRRISMESQVFRRQPPILYSDGGKRDPFNPLIVDSRRDGPVDTDLLIIDGAILKGVVWSEGQYLAMVKDKQGKMFFLREGDVIYRGRVLMVTQSQARFEVSDFGDVDYFTLKVKG
jgi:hypothetical protein